MSSFIDGGKAAFLLEILNISEQLLKKNNSIDDEILSNYNCSKMNNLKERRV